MKNSLLPFGPIYTGKVTMNFPFLFPKVSMNTLTDKFTVIFTNLNASKIEYTWDGKKTTGQFFYAPGVCKVYFAISVATVGSLMSLAVLGDETNMEEPQYFIDAFRKINAQVLAGEV
mmetsp:Transcript_4435/g.6548  ORF Transcript_4435/g.6548 Transcript_4435/m.6548 type:complete len:117 (+) Transcript_4435:1173-1523(+)